MTGYKVGAHNLQIIEKDNDLSATTWAQNKYVPKIQANTNVGEVSDVFPAQLEKYQHAYP